MICSFCGAVVLRGAAFCMQCGAPQTQAVEQQERSRGPAARDFDHWAPPREATHRDGDERDRAAVVPPPYLVVPVQASIRWEPAQSGGAWNFAPAPELQAPSFKKRAVVAFFLYFLFFFPGLIASAIWWRQANHFQRRTGIAPPGKGTLAALLGFGLVVLSLWILSAIV